MCADKIMLYRIMSFREILKRFKGKSVGYCYRLLESLELEITYQKDYQGHLFN